MAVSQPLAQGYRLGPRVPHWNMENVADIERRATTTTGNSPTFVVPRDSTCSPGNNSPECEKPTSPTSLTVPITIAVVVFVVIVLGVIFYLHRRSVKRQRMEDNDEKYKSLDFGDDITPKGGKGSKRRSLMFGSKDKDTHRAQLSMDMNLSSPYLLPPELQTSRESLHSLARTLHQNEDPYRPIAKFTGSDGGSTRGSIRSYNKPLDGRSIQTKMTQSTTDAVGSPITRKQLTDQFPQPPAPVQEMPEAHVAEIVSPPERPEKSEFRFVDDDESAIPQVPPPVHTEDRVHMPAMPSMDEPAPAEIPQSSLPQKPSPLRQSDTEEHSYVAGLVGDRESMILPALDLPHLGNGLGLVDSAPEAHSLPPRKQSLPASSKLPEEYHDYSNDFQFNITDEPVHEHGYDDPSHQTALHDEMYHEQDHPQSAGLGVPQQDNRRLSVGFRPLPPDEFLESEDPEFRANRIRSFYKEYFEETKYDDGKANPMPQQGAYYEDYDATYLGDAAYFDPDTNAFVMPYAQPVTRRAMTPPPNSRRPMPGPRQPGPRGPMGMPYGRPMGPGGRPRAGSTMSAGGRWTPGGPPRPNSSASGQGGKPKKRLPPPADLTTLPTPSKLRDDSFLIINPIDFAPPPTMRDAAAGRSQSPVGERRPYQLKAPIHSPLVSAFEETPDLPSPHLLRKSGTFTALDFAPPRRFKDPDAMSDAGSIRSNRSGISAKNLGAIRNGAGRVSRLPGDTVFTQVDMADTLKPQWGMRN